MTETDRAIKELELAGWFKSDSAYNGMIGKAVKELLELFQKQGHSGASASITSNVFNQIVMGGILTPLTGKIDEWVDVTCGNNKPMFQNKRASNVFAEDCNGLNAIDVHGKVLEEPDGSRWTNSSCQTSVTFPYTPTQEVIKTDGDLNPIDA